ncbi:hypothetical protein [Enemella evansiae]|uniref:hypothetical protein n=1 Tax=Enemella evansiae TaxID=2016499 RepID=UPI003983C1B2
MDRQGRGIGQHSTCRSTSPTAWPWTSGCGATCLCAQRFRGGMIYWSPGAGSWPVRAASWTTTLHNHRKRDDSATRHPTSRAQNFPWGPIIWDSVTGTRG